MKPMPDAVVGLIHAYPSKYLIESLGADGWKVFLVGPEKVIKDWARHPSVIAAVVVDLCDHVGAVKVIVERASEYSISCFLPVYEGGVVISAMVSETLGLPSMPTVTAMSSRNKYLSFLLWDAQGISVPATIPLIEPKLSWPLIRSRFSEGAVIKLADSMNSQGVVLVRDEESYQRAIETLHTMLAQDKNISTQTDRNRQAYGAFDVKLIAQEYCDGVEVGVEILIEKEKETILGVFEKATASGPCFAESMSICPTSLSAIEERRVCDLASCATRALGFSSGVAHVEVRYHAGEPKVLEAGLRPGGAYTAMAVERLSGVNEYVSSLRSQLSLPQLDRRPKKAKVALYGGIVHPRSGLLQGVSGCEVFDEIDGLSDLQILHKLGDEVYALPNSAQPHYCYYLLEGENRTDLLALHAEIQKRVTVFIDNFPAVEDVEVETLKNLS